MTNINEIQNAILSGNFTTQELQHLSKVVHAKFLLARKQETAIKQYTLKVGDRVKISNIRPKKYSETTGEIAEIKGKRVTVRLDDRFSYIGGSVSGIPLSCVSKTDE